MSDDAARARETALGLLARREHSRREMLVKLECRGYESPVTEDVIDALIDEGLLSEQRFASGYISARADRGRGPRRLRAELQQRGVESSLIDAALDDADVDWAAVAARARRKRFGDGAPADLAERARQVRFLEYRGFDGGTIRRVLDGE